MPKNELTFIFNYRIPPAEIQRFAGPEYVPRAFTIHGGHALLAVLDG